MGRVIVIGTGRLAQAVARSVRAQGGDAVAVGRRQGVDVTRGVDLTPFVGEDGVAAVVEASGTTASGGQEIRRFFESSARHVAAGAAAVGAQAHVVVSIVGCERVAGHDYYAGKAAQEAAARAAATPGVRAVVVRTTQWFELARQMVDRLARGPVMVVPQMRVRPVSLDAVADVVGQVVLGTRARADTDLAGPGETTLAAMVRALQDRPALRVPVPLPGAGRAARTGALLPGDDVERVGPTFRAWLREHPDGRRPDLVG